MRAHGTGLILLFLYIKGVRMDAFTMQSKNKIGAWAHMRPPLLGVNGAEYIGCYSDTSDRDLSGWFQRTHNTPQICVNTCKNKGFQYAGVQAGYACLCGNAYGKYGALNETECRTPCNGDGTQFCGGSWANAIYNISETETTLSPTQRTTSGRIASANPTTITETMTSSHKPPITIETSSSKPTETETTPSQSKRNTTTGTTSDEHIMSTQKPQDRNNNTAVHEDDKISEWVNRHIPLVAGIAVTVGMTILIPLLVFAVKSKYGATSLAPNAG